MTFPGYRKPDAAMIDAGVLYHRNPDASNLIGVGPTRGGLNFDPGKTTRNIEFDGGTTPIEELDRVVEYLSVLEGTMIDFSRASFGIYEPGSTSADSSSMARIQPINATEFLSEGAYVHDLLWIFRNQDNTITVIGMPRALCTTYRMVSTDKNEVTAEVRFEARLPKDATNLNAAPYRIFKCADIDALDALFPGFWNLDGYEG